MQLETFAVQRLSVSSASLKPSLCSDCQFAASVKRSLCSVQQLSVSSASVKPLCSGCQLAVTALNRCAAAVS